MTIETKLCNKHNNGQGEYLPLDQFNKTGNICRECRNSNRRKRWASHGHTLYTQYSVMKSLAIRHGHDWKLTYEEWLHIIKLPCIYNGSQMHQDGIRTGIDRRDNEQGYTLTNSVPCCARHNQIKSNVFTYEQMLTISKAYGLQCGNTTGGRRKI